MSEILFTPPPFAMDRLLDPWHAVSMTILFLISMLAAGSPEARAQGLPAWLDHRTIKVEVLDDAGRIQGPRREITRGMRVRVRHFQGRGPEILERLNREVTEETLDVDAPERWEARDQAHDFEWVVGRDVSLRHLRRLLAPKWVSLPLNDLSARDGYRVPSAVLLEIDGQRVQDYPPRHCPLALEN